jgi:hypothetical protein
VLTHRGESNSAYAIWAADDPHAQAYAVLFTPESQRMVQALNLGNAPDAAAKADRCLACHSLPVSGARTADARGNVSVLLSDGVSCEACHGPAEKYLAAHTMQGWHPPGDSQFDSSLRMKNTVDIASRAKICAGCHVGQPDAEGRPWRDVNHDLIAAGHPRLNFDFAAYMATLPAHWNAKKHPERFDELHSLVAGQFMTADAALKVLETRANAAKQPAISTNADKSYETMPFVSATWPEFSEYDCFACHHDLRGRSWRQQLIQPGDNPLRSSAADSTDAPQPKRGSPGWGTWYFETPRILAHTPAIISPTDGKHWLASLNQLTLAMQSPAPEPAKVAALAHDSGVNLETAWSSSPWSALLTAPTADPQSLRTALLKSLATEFKRHRPSDWDQFVQYYLALVAIERSQNPTDVTGPIASASAAHPTPIDEVLLEIRNRLSFPSDEEAASGNSTDARSKTPLAGSKSILRILRQGFNSPLKFDPDAKQEGAARGDLAGKNLAELFDEAFRLLGDPKPT